VRNNPDTKIWNIGEEFLADLGELRADLILMTIAKKKKIP
jgi:hypothetical protein